MDFKIGDKVTRNSYGNDVVFIIIDIVDGIYYLKGINFRLFADCNYQDLKKYDDDILDDVEYLNRINLSV